MVVHSPATVARGRQRVSPSLSPSKSLTMQSTSAFSTFFFKSPNFHLFPLHTNSLLPSLSFILSFNSGSSRPNLSSVLKKVKVVQLMPTTSTRSINCTVHCSTLRERNRTANTVVVGNRNRRAVNTIVPSNN